MSKTFFIPYGEKLGSIALAIDTLQQVLYACLEYRNLAIEKGATQEELETSLYTFDKEEFANTIDMAFRGLNFLYLNLLSEASCQPQEKPNRIKELTKSIQDINDVLKDSADGFINDLLRTDLISVPTKRKRELIKLCIKNPLPSFPTEEVKSRIQNMDYQDFLKTPYWKAIALYVKEKAGKKCSMCGATKALEVHHLTYDNHGDELHHLEDLTCICRKCHENLHSK